MEGADLVPALEIAVTAIALIQGFAAARDHAHLNAARDLVQRLGDALAGSGSGAAMSDREQAEQLTLLARSGLAADHVAGRIVLLSWVWAVATAVIGAVGVALGLLGDPVSGVIVAVVATVITVIVAWLGWTDNRSVRSQLAELRERSTVGLLATASEQLRQESTLEKAVETASLAATRNPRLAWPYLLRAQAQLRLGREDLAHADIERVLHADPAQVAGMFDEIAREDGLDPSPAMVQAFVAAHRAVPEEARRRFLSHVSGFARRSVIGHRSDETGAASAANPDDPLVQAALDWRNGNLLQARDGLVKLLERESEPERVGCVTALLCLLLNTLGDYREALKVPVSAVPGHWAQLVAIARADALSGTNDVEAAQKVLFAVPMASGLRRLASVALFDRDESESGP